jgi:hypothetical protein
MSGRLAKCCSTLNEITYSIEDTGALIVIDIRVKVVDADGVDTKNLHESSISHAFILVAQGVLPRGRVVAGTASRLVGHTNNLELVASFGVDEVSSLDLQRRNGTHNRGPEGHESGVDLNRMLMSLWCNKKQCAMHMHVLVARGSTYKHGDNVILNLLM